MVYDYLIVGAGFSGAAFARGAAEKKKTVLIVDKNDHIGGNAYDFINKEGLIVQKYGPHIFHTKSKMVWIFLKRFTEWNGYVHKVLVDLKDKQVYLPINIDTLEKIYSRTFTPEEMKNFIDKKKYIIKYIRNSEDVVLSSVGDELYKLFFKNYTKKQWGVYPGDLEPSVLRRIPVRFNRDIRYFNDRFQGIPKKGFNFLFKNLLESKNIEVLLNTDYKNIKKKIKYKKMIYTGAIDSYFDFKFGKLPYRSLDFDFETVDKEFFQNEAVVNYPNYKDYTRITEFKHFYFQKNKKTTICYEYPKAIGEPFYPIPMPENRKLYLRYKKEAKKLKNIFFLGRLAEYKYINMDIAVENSIKLFNEIDER